MRDFTAEADGIRAEMRKIVEETCAAMVLAIEEIRTGFIADEDVERFVVGVNDLDFRSAHEQAMYDLRDLQHALDVVDGEAHNDDQRHDSRVMRKL